jgi:hypothetical protein
MERQVILRIVSTRYFLLDVGTRTETWTFRNFADVQSEHSTTELQPQSNVWRKYLITIGIPALVCFYRTTLNTAELPEASLTE